MDWLTKLQIQATTTSPTDLNVFVDCPPSHPTDRSKFSGIMIVGEAPGENEQKYGIPFHPNGVAGKILRSNLLKVDTQYGHSVGIDPESCWITNVFKERPTSNKITKFFDTEKHEETTDIPKRVGKYLIGGYKDNLLYLWKEILEYAKPNLILACGAVPLWFFTGEDRIGERRGSIEDFGTFRVLFTCHPMATIYNPSYREFFESDVGYLKQLWLEQNKQNVVM